MCHATLLSTHEIIEPMPHGLIGQIQSKIIAFQNASTSVGDFLWHIAPTKITLATTGYQLFLCSAIWSCKPPCKVPPGLYFTGNTLPFIWYYLKTCLWSFSLGCFQTDMRPEVAVEASNVDGHLGEKCFLLVCLWCDSVCQNRNFISTRTTSNTAHWVLLEPHYHRKN